MRQLVNKEEEEKMSFRMDASVLIGKTVKDDLEREVGKVVSFLIDSSGQINEVLIEKRNGTLSKYAIDRLKVSQDEIFLLSHFDKRMEIFSEKFPIVRKKRQILDKLSDSKVVPPEIYDSLCKEFDKNMKEMKSEAQNLLNDIEKEMRAQEEYIKMLQLSRALLEIEHEIGMVKDEIYQQSLMSILKEMKNSQQRKLNLLKNKDKLLGILREEEPKIEEKSEGKVETVNIPESIINEEKVKEIAESTKEEEVITVHMTQ